MKYLLTLISTLLLFASCSKDSTFDPPSVPTERTVLIYMSGENNLTEYGNFRALHYDLQEIIEGSKSLAANQRLLVYVDSLNTNIQRAGNPYIMEVRGGKAAIIKRFDSDFYSCDPARFHEILEWSYQYAPADSYGLVLWGHANGWIVLKDSIPETAASRGRRTYGQDNGTDMGQGIKHMNITQMARALKGLPKLDFIFADCCNMMCAEVAYELKDATRYLIGSPAEISTAGAPYDLIIPELFGSAPYSDIAEIYYDFYMEFNRPVSSLNGFSVPVSVINTQYMGELAEATRDILGKLTTPIPTYPGSLKPSDQGIAYYYRYDQAIMYDMRAFVKLNTSSEDFQAWDRIYQLAVPYYQMSMRWDTNSNTLKMVDFYTFNQDQSLYGCVSMFIPLTSYEGSDLKYNQTFKNFAWNRVLNWERFGWTE